MGLRPFIFLIGSSLVVGPSTALDQVKNKKDGASLSSNAGAPSSARAALMRSEWDPTNGIEIAKGHTRRDKLSLFPSGASLAGEPGDAAHAVVLPADANTHKDAMRIGAMAGTAAFSPQLGGHAGEVQKSAPAEKAAGTTETIGRKTGSLPTASGALMQAADGSAFSSADAASGSQQARNQSLKDVSQSNGGSNDEQTPAATLAPTPAPTPPPVVKVSLTVSSLSFADLSNDTSLLIDFKLNMRKGFAESAGFGSEAGGLSKVAVELSAGSGDSVQVDATLTSEVAHQTTNDDWATAVGVTADVLEDQLKANIDDLTLTIKNKAQSVANIGSVTIPPVTGGTSQYPTVSLSVSAPTITEAVAATLAPTPSPTLAPAPSPT